MGIITNDATTAVEPTSISRALTARARQTRGDVARAVHRLDSIDLLRGLLMIIMLIDHTRDVVHRDGLTVDPLALATTTPLLYFTRWITHLCAPGFAFLAGTSAGLQRHRGTSISALSRFLWTRGLSLVLIELGVIRFIGSFNFDPNYLANLQVIWVIGIAMIALAALIHLPQRVVLSIGLLIVCGHNLLDGITVKPWISPSAPPPTVLGKLWILLHQGGFFPLFDSPTPLVWVHYPVLPWIGVLAVGYVFADLWLLPAPRRGLVLWQLGWGMLATFVVLRAFNIYGDPAPWQRQDTLFKSIAAFMNVQKYPPSLLYLLATLSPCLLCLSLLQGRTFDNRFARAIITYGRVPMFFYLLQWLWAHAGGLTVSAIHGMPVAVHFQSRAQTFMGAPAPVFGGTLLDVYVCWFLGIVALYFPCRWYAGVKARRRDLILLRYL